MVMMLYDFCRLNVGVDWNEYYGIVDVDVMVIVFLFYYIVEVLIISGEDFLFDVLKKG